MAQKILIFSIAYQPFWGGAEVAIKEITDRLPDFAFDMITLGFDRKLPKFERVGNVNVYRIGFCADSADGASLNRFPLKINKYLFPLLALAKAFLLHKKNNYDIAWVMMANYAGFAGMFFKFLNKKVKYLLTLQEGDPLNYYRRRVSFLFPLFRQIFIRADRIQAISNYLGDYARAMGYRGGIDIVPNGVDIALFSAAQDEKALAELKEKFNKKSGNIFVITTSRLAVKNAVCDVISAFKYLPENFKFLILGKGEEEIKLKELAKEIGADKRIFFIGHVSYAAIPQYLKISDIFIRPSLSEGFGNSFVEAMAAEIPVIATPVGGIVDFLFDPQSNPDKEPTGVFCEANNPESIAEKIKMLAGATDLREKIIQNAKQMVLEKYGWETVAKQMRQVFRKVEIK